MPRTTQQAKRPTRLAPASSAWIVAACILLLCVVPLGVHIRKYPDFAGFWAGVDQQRYLAAARAWAAGDISPSEHHYLPLYPLMGAAFVWLTPFQPFMLPDIACLVGSLLIFLRIGRRLAPGWPPAALAMCFVVATLGGRTLAAIWVVPWSTTGSAPFQFLAVLFVLRFTEHPKPARAAWFGLAAGLVAGFRPSDAAVLLAAGSAYAAWAMRRDRLPAAAWLGCAASGAAGLAAGLLPALGAHALVFGLSAGPYVSESASIGLEWRLLALRWVTIVVGPRPLLPDGTGMAVGLPWIAPGLAGMAWAVLRSPRRVGPAALAAGTVVLHWVLYLTYRDLQPTGLWRFYNIHYFKWTFPFLVLWATELAGAFASRRTCRQAVLASLATAPLFLWRAELRRAMPLAGTMTGRTLSLSVTPLMPTDAVLLPVLGSWDRLYLSPASLVAGGRRFAAKRDFKIIPVADGGLLLPLRPLPAGPDLLDLPDGVAFDATRPIRLFRQSLVFGLPCGWFDRHRPVCDRL